MTNRQSNRRIVERRVYNDPRHDGPERRKPPREPRSKFGLIIGAIAAFIIADATLWGGQYRHAVIHSFYAQTGEIRDWSAHVWDRV